MNQNEGVGSGLGRFTEAQRLLDERRILGGRRKQAVVAVFHVAGRRPCRPCRPACDGSHRMKESDGVSTVTSDIFPNRELYQFGYCALFARGIAPADLLVRVGGEGLQPVALTHTEIAHIEALGEELGLDDVPEVDFDRLAASGVLAGDGPLLRAGEHDGWSFVIEPDGPYLAADDIVKSASLEAVAFSLRDGETGAWITYAEYGEILSSFDPLFPDSDYGTRPEVLEQLAGHLAAIDTGDRDDAYTNAVRAIRQRLRCTVPPEADERPLLTIKIADGY
ncbi:DUF6461 domain-containing protein [Streptomyces sp. NPDC058739]|uniref:DUF6461 domain-containing protein n=1 Tax=Streptomyces sp. NPDC058739 TaxID=3346618 RepID=UPI00368028A0